MKIYPFQEQIILREELAHRYAIALDEYDTHTLAEVIAVAFSDPKLSKLIPCKMIESSIVK